MNVLQLDRNDLLRMILLGCFGFLVVYLVRCIREKKQPPLMTLRNAAWLMFCVYGAALLSLTGITVFLTDPGSVVWQNPLRGFDTTPFDGHVFLPILQNFLLFVPLGFLLPSVSPKAHWRLGTAALCGFGISLTIELLQGLIGRMQELDDLIMNTAGTAAGFMAWAALFRRETRLWERIVILILDAALCWLLLYTAWELCAIRSL